MTAAISPAEFSAENDCEVCGEHPAAVTVVFHDTPGLTFRYCAAPDCRDDLMRSIK